MVVLNKLTVKTLNNSDTFHLTEVDTSQTVKALKETVEAKTQWAVACQKLICAGKIMSDDKLLSDYKMKDGGFVVCMVSKAKAKAKVTAPAPAAAAATDSSSSSSASATASAAGASAAAAATTTAPAAAATTTTTTPAATAATTDATPAAAAAAPVGPLAAMNPSYLPAHANLTAMGFPAEESARALTAAFGNPDRAVEYLSDGIPEDAAAQAAPSAAAPAAGGAAGAVAASAATALAGATGSDRLESLRQHPQFNSLRQIVQTNPQMLGEVLQQLGARDPELLTAINADRERFVSMMNEPIAEGTTQVQAPAAGMPGGMPAALAGAFGGGGGGAGGPGPQELASVFQAMQQMPEADRANLLQAMGIPPEQQAAISQMMQSPEALQQLLGGMGGAGGAPGGGGAPPGSHVIQLTTEEAASIGRLQELGFSRDACVQAYLACDKQEELAANFLFSNPDMDTDP